MKRDRSAAVRHLPGSSTAEAGWRGVPRRDPERTAPRRWDATLPQKPRPQPRTASVQTPTFSWRYGGRLLGAGGGAVRGRAARVPRRPRRGGDRRDGGPRPGAGARPGAALGGAGRRGGPHRGQAPAPAGRGRGGGLGPRHVPLRRGLPEERAPAGQRRRPPVRRRQRERERPRMRPLESTRGLGADAGADAPHAAVRFSSTTPASCAPGPCWTRTRRTCRPRSRRTSSARCW